MDIWRSIHMAASHNRLRIPTTSRSNEDVSASAAAYFTPHTHYFRAAPPCPVHVLTVEVICIRLGIGCSVQDGSEDVRTIY